MSIGTIDEFKTECSALVLRMRLLSLKKHATKVFVLRVFAKVIEEILQEGTVIELEN